MYRLILLCALFIGCASTSMYSEASNLLDRLVILTNNPQLIESTTASEVHEKIQRIFIDLDRIQNILRDRGSSNGVLLVIDHLKIAWNRIDEDMCTKEAWLTNPVPLDEADKKIWHYFLEQVDKHYSDIDTYLEMKNA